LPATLNPDILTGLLRGELAFPGVIVTDAMEMGAITEHYGEAESVVMAVEAGADMLWCPFLWRGPVRRCCRRWLMDGFRKPASMRPWSGSFG
jgi:hypothetical protein